MKKRTAIIFIAAVLMLVFCLNFSNPKALNNKVDSKVYESLSTEGNARVIVLLKNSQDINEKNTIKKTALNNVRKEKVKREFSSFNGFSAVLNQTEINSLAEQENVEKIIYDKRVRAFLTDSVPLINADLASSLKIEGINLTGQGQTVCVIDTGVNYTHESLGGCRISNYSLSGTNVSYILQSTHPYSNNYDHVWKINYTGFSKIAVHFVNLSLEYQGQDSGYDSYDRVIIYDTNMTEIASYHGINGIASDFWTPYSEGDTIYVRLATDIAVQDYGFYIDQIRDGETNTTYNWTNCSKIVYGWDFVNNDGDPKDDNGHGTHVTGIVSANGTIKGVTPNAKIVAAKSLDYDGSGWNSDILYAIEFCTNLSEEYNISVISMSLGDSINYTGYCDSSDTLTASAINAAVAKNISVIVASGNEGNSSAISSPACIQNATPVSSSTKTPEEISYFSNRNWMVKLFAPGSNIVSTWYNGASMSESGTSMAAPHVSGAIAIINQYLNSIGETKTPAEIENILWATGKPINDTENMSQNFTRIDIYAALLSIDETSPIVNLSSPSNNTINLSQNQTFICNTSDWQLKNVTFYLWNSSELYYNETKNISGTTNSTSFSVNNMPFEDYKWNCFSYDLKNNGAFAESNFSVTIGGITISINSPQNNTYTKNDFTEFNCSTSTSTDRQIKNITFYLYENGSLVTSVSQNLTGEQNSSLFNFTFENESNYVWGCESYSNESEKDAKNYTISYDISLPEINSISETATTNQVTLSFTSSENTNYTVELNGATYSNNSFSTNHELTIQGLSSSTTYNYNLTFCDLASNCNNLTRSFATSSETRGPSGGGGGGGGSTPTKITDAQLSSGYSKKYYAGERAYFSVAGQNHSIQLNKIINNTANITIRSEQINIVIQNGEEKKINLTSQDYYDLFVKIENITLISANITIKKIEEKIVSAPEEKNESNTKLNKTYNASENNIQTPTEVVQKDVTVLYFVLLILTAVFVYFLLRKRSDKKENKEDKKE